MTAYVQVRVVCKSCGQDRCRTARGLCSTCYSREKRHGTLDQWPLERTGQPQAIVVEDTTWLAQNQVPAAEWGERLGMTHSALERALYRAGQVKLAREVSKVRRALRPKRREKVVV